MGDPCPSWYTPRAWALQQVCSPGSRAHRIAWATRHLWWKLDRNQRRLHEQLKGNGKKRKVLSCSRRIGKTYILVHDADAFAWRTPGARIVFAAPTLKDLEDIVLEAFDEYFRDCPEPLRPKWLPTKKRFRYPNGAEIRLVGCDDRRKANRARGRAIHRVYIEEAGSNPVLRYLIHSVLAQSLLSTGGQMWVASSPPDTEGHEFASMAQAAERAGTLAHCTIWDCPRYTLEEVNDFIREEADALGMSAEEYKQSPEYEREFMGRLVTDPTRAVLPECTPQRMDAVDGWLAADGTPAVVREMPDVPMFRDRYESMDLGFHPHYTAVLFAYWDYERQVLVVEDELIQQRLNDTRLAWLIGGRKENGKLIALEPDDAALVGPWGMEKKLWGPHQPYLRVADNNYPMTLSELAVHHGLTFVATEKDEKEAAIINTRRWIRLGKIAIHPRCKALIAQMRAAIWNRHRTQFAEVSGFGHFDLVDALIYLVRNVIPNADRVPLGWGFNRSDMYQREKPTRPVSKDTRALVGGLLRR